MAPTLTNWFRRNRFSIIGSCIIFAGLCFLNKLTAEQVAAWVQAVGSILAIISAAVIIQWQHQLDAHRAQIDDATKLCAYLNAVLIVAQRAQTLGKFCYGRAFNESGDVAKPISQDLKSEIEEVIVLLRAVPIFEYPVKNIASYVLQLRASLSDLLDSQRVEFRFNRAVLLDPLTPDRLRDINLSINSCVEEILKINDIAEIYRSGFTPVK